MNYKKIVSGLVILSAVAASVFGQQLKLKRTGKIARVMAGKKILYKVALRGKENERGRKYDEAFLAGACLIVRRDVRVIETGTESYPDVSRIEIYRPNGKMRIYRESGIAISRIHDWDLINSPDFSWAIVPDNGEAMFDGYFYVSPQCEIRQVMFDRESDFDWGSREDVKFIDAATLKLSPISIRSSGEKKKTVDIFITRDGKFRVEKND